MSKRYSQKHVDEMQTQIDELRKNYIEQIHKTHEWKEFAMDVAREHLPHSELIELLQGALEKYVDNKVSK